MTEQNPCFKQLWIRLKDHNKVPRRWWHPPQEPEHVEQNTLLDLHAKCSDTIRRTMLVILSSSLFVLLTTLTIPDRFFILEANPSFKLQGAVLSLQGFLIAATFLLIVELIYLHIFYGYLHQLEAMGARRGARVPTLFNLNRHDARLATEVIFYWWIPMILFAIAFKVSVRPPWAIGIYSTATVTLAALTFLRIRRCQEHQRRGLWWRWILIFLIIPAWPIMVWELHSCSLYHCSLFRSLDFAKAELSSERLDGLFLVGADFTKASLEKADFSGSRLRSASFNEALLSEAILIDTDLRNADLSNATLIGAELMRADLTEAILTSTRLNEANLEGATLIGANLRDAVLEDAKLRGADLTDADLSGANLREADVLQKQLDKACGDLRTKPPQGKKVQRLCVSD